MNWQAINFDWNQVRAFLATAEEGSLSAAARALGQTQPTLSRQVSALEEALGVTLFERGPRTMALTQAGRELLSDVRAMADAATRLSLVASGQSQDVQGDVTITATDLFAASYLPTALAELREMAPGLLINVIASNELRDLVRREADIAIRHARPEQPDLIAKLINETTAHLYASTDFLDRHGRPKRLEDVLGMNFVGMEARETILPFLRNIGLPLSEQDIVVTSSTGTLLVELLRQGLGVSFLPKHTAERFSDLEMVFPDLAPIPIPVWLVTHRELRTSRRIRIVFDHLALALSPEGLST